MSTPTEQFAHLSIESDPLTASMAPPEEVRSRAVHLQDILSSFFDVLPAELEPQIVSNIHDNMSKPYQHRPKNEDWTISGNLVGTLMQRGAYTDEGWDFLRTFQSANALANIFAEKLEKRFKRCHEDYDALIEKPPATQELKDKLAGIVEQYTKLSDTLNHDRERRSKIDDIPLFVEARTLQLALDVLLAVCQRNQDIIPSSPESSRRTTRRTTSNVSAHPGLFGLLIKEPESTDEPFLLASLEKFSGRALKECLNSLKLVNGELNRKGAPESYISRFEALQALANDESQAVTAPKTPDVPRGGGSGLEAEPRPGSKRAQPAVEVPPKRGKRTGGR